MPEFLSWVSRHHSRVLLISSILLGIWTNASAQQEVSVGFKGGKNFANLQSSSAQSFWDSRIGNQGGIFGSIRKGKNAIQIEIIYSTNNHTRAFYPSMAQSYYYTDQFSYLNFPIFFKRYFGNSFNLEAGPQIGFLVKSYGLLTADNYGNYVEGNFSNINRTNLSLCFGAGWDFPAGFLIDIRYNIGVSDTNTNSSSWTNRNRVVQLSIGWRFKLKKKGIEESK